MSHPKDSRQQALRHWLRQQRADWDGQLQPASSDASFRRYFRLHTAEGSLIAMDAPPPLEDCRPFIDVQQRLQRAGLHVPHIHAADVEQGFLLLEDLGQTPYLQALNAKTVTSLYGDALGALRQLQCQTDPTGLPEYTAEKLLEEMELFRHWLLGVHLHQAERLSDGQWRQLTGWLVDSALEQSTCLVHRDYHSRNLMYLSAPAINPGIIDFQDAVIGPVTYDLVSLLKDCYIAWPRVRVESWVEHYRQGLHSQGQAVPGPARFLQQFHRMGVQRHLKAAGIFARLLHRDGKPGYMQDVPRTLGYILELKPEAPLKPLQDVIATILPQLQQPPGRT